MVGNIDCFIHNNEVIIDEYPNLDIFKRYYNNDLMPSFLYFRIIDNEVFKYAANQSDCIFGNYKEMKNSNPEYFI